MVAAEAKGGRAERGRVAHPEEYFSILMALGGTAASLAFLWLAPGYQPASGIAWALPGWIAGAYLFLQILFLLVSATQVRALGVVDSVISIVPVIAGVVMVVEYILGHLPLSLFQLNGLGLLIATSLGEFLLTVWIRFVLNRRTIALDAG